MVGMFMRDYSVDVALVPGNLLHLLFPFFIAGLRLVKHGFIPVT